MAPQIILLPGNMCDSRLWRGGDEIIVRTATDHHPGPIFDADLTQDDSIAAMARRALSATHGPLLPVGFSMGAIVAVEMAVQAPDRIAALVLAGYNATADLPDRAAHRPVQQAAVRAGELERVLVEELKPNYLAAQNRDNGPLRDLLRDMGIGLGADIFLRQSEALRLREDRRAALAMLEIPILHLCGAEDALCPPAWHRNWAAMTRYGRFEEIAGAGHMLPLEAPAAFARVLDHWMTQNKGVWLDG